jgi:hypothetical protein
VELTARHVVKTYTCHDAVEKVQYLKSIYQYLKEVPNTDSLYFCSEETIVLQPRGLLAKPTTEKELLEAVSCVLEVLKVGITISKLEFIVDQRHQVIHGDSLFHRDIRWPNVIQRKVSSLLENFICLNQLLTTGYWLLLGVHLSSFGRNIGSEKAGKGSSC